MELLPVAQKTFQYSSEYVSSSNHSDGLTQHIYKTIPGSSILSLDVTNKRNFSALKSTQHFTLTPAVARTRRCKQQNPLKRQITFSTATGVTSSFLIVTSFYRLTVSADIIAAPHHVQRHTHTNTHTNTYSNTNTYTHKHTYTHTNTHTQTHTHTYTHTNTHTNTHTHKHTYTHKHTHTHTHT